jgi:hypothetical protein
VVDGATATPALMALTNRFPQPMSVGRRGDWRVEGDGVMDVHAFLVFDGRTLFVCSASPWTPAFVCGHPVGSEWTPLGPGGRVALGRAGITYEISTATVCGLLPVSSAPGVVMSAGTTEKRNRRPRRFPWWVTALTLVAGLALALEAIPFAPRGMPQSTGTRALAWDAPAANAPSSSSAPPVPDRPAAATSAAPASKAGGEAEIKRPLGARAATKERAAVDAVSAGAWDRAAVLYGELANETPKEPKWRAAARIAAAKSARGGT